jgi:hypothetical protein
MKFMAKYLGLILLCLFLLAIESTKDIVSRGGFATMSKEVYVWNKLFYCLSIL